jgi:hypothetical protein
MMFATPADRDYKVNPVLAKAMDRILRFMLTTNKMHLRLQFVLLVLLVQTHMHVSLLVSLHFGDLLTVVQTKLYLKC